MAKKNTQNGPHGRSTTLKELVAVEELFKKLEKDKQLPTFAEFFVTSIMLGNAECVNLKAMFPTLYKELKAWLAHNSET